MTFFFLFLSGGYAIILVMKKKEILILAVLAAIAAVLIVLMKVRESASQDDGGVTVAVYHRNQIVLEFSSAKDAVYTVDGDYGTLDVEVKDGKWHVTNEECPNHVCAQMGWVGPGEFLPITCLPNNVVVVEETPAS